MQHRWLGLSAMGMLAIGILDCGTPNDADAIGDVGAVRQAIQGGETDAVHRFAVGLCRGGRSNDPRATCPARCSGALILPNLVATARHCVSDSPSTVDCTATSPTFGALKGGQLLITTNQDLFGTATIDASGSGWYSVKSITVPTDNHLCGNDIALITLNKLVPTSEAKPVIPGVQYLMWDPAASYKRNFAAIGYGNASASPDLSITPTSPTYEGSGIRRKREFLNVICTPGADVLDCPAEAKIPKNEFVGSDGICAGDSGSSAFEKQSYLDGAPVSFGVLSRGGESGSTCQGSVYTRFDGHRDFVIETAKQASASWTLYPEPTWTAQKPAPTTSTTTTSSSGATAELGETCRSSSVCKSQLCVDPGDGNQICTKICDANKADSCPSGYACADSMCLPAEASTPAAPKVVRQDSGCKVTSGRANHGFFSMILAAFALFVHRRDRVRRARSRR